ncbi:bifunctional glycosyltransferase family 2/GtrA family protein [Companilactobacillus musae]|uniref:bifunctional glycosyltransferase family 2/GtrA family protein n=1 Tax=Companilactobacillus musae TaxID=1903258 RepID=UPI00342C5C1B
MLQIGVIIPALNPDEKLITLIQEITNKKNLNLPITNLIIIDDGSDSDHDNIFDQLSKLAIPKLTILHHKKNLGKGAALKTGFTFAQKHFPDLTGIATMDSDGQHTVEALNSCLKKFSLNPDQLVIGVRHFTNSVPFRSQFGNVLTSKLVRILTHQNISDTQTGLRIIPMTYTKDLISFPGNRFEFEFDMLLQAKKFNIKVVEQPIPTIISRVLSSVVNYVINHRIVFNHAGQRTFIKYGCLFIVQMLASGFFTNALTSLLPITNGQLMPTVAKMIVDFILFIISYQIQRDFIFKEVSQNVQ